MRESFETFVCNKMYCWINIRHLNCEDNGGLNHRACCIYKMDNPVGFSILRYFSPNRSNILYITRQVQVGL